MATKAEIIASFKAQYPTLKVGSDEEGYTDLPPTEYEATISAWADNQLAQEAAEKAVTDEKAAILAKIGITEAELRIALG